MRVLVTGAAGFLGRTIVPALAARGHTPFAAGHDAEWPVDLRVPELVAELFRETRPDVVVHLAASATPPDTAGGPAELESENVVHPLLNVDEVAGRRPVILASTARVYGRAPTVEGGPLRPADLYAASRASAEALGTRRAAAVGGQLTVVRPFLVLGPGVSPRSEVGGWLTRAAAGAPGIPTLSLDREVDLLDVRDAVEGFCVLIERGAAGGVYNLASGTTLSMRTLFATLCPGATPVEAATRPEPARLVGEAPALRALGWVPRVPLAETLAAVTVHRRERRR